MKTWNVPEVEELDVRMTAGGIINVHWEGPFGIICGDGNHGGDNNQPGGDQPGGDQPGGDQPGSGTSRS